MSLFFPAYLETDGSIPWFNVPMESIAEISSYFSEAPKTVNAQGFYVHSYFALEVEEGTPSTSKVTRHSISELVS